MHVSFSLFASMHFLNHLTPEYLNSFVGTGRSRFSLFASSADLGLMFAVGAGFVILGAALRHRLRPSAAPAPQEAQCRSVDGTEMNPPARKAKPTNGNSAPSELQAFLAAKETLTETATTNERH
jgi:hypothetical protein